MKIEAPATNRWRRLLEALVSLGCCPVDSGDADLRTIEKDKCAPEDFYSTTNHKTYVRAGGSFIEVQDQRMDALVVVRDGQAWCRKLRDIKAGRSGGGRHARHSRDPGIQGARPVGVLLHEQRHLVRTPGRDRRAADSYSDPGSSRDAGQKIIVVAGPVVVHTGGVGATGEADPRADMCRLC